MLKKVSRTDSFTSLFSPTKSKQAAKKESLSPAPLVPIDEDFRKTLKNSGVVDLTQKIWNQRSSGLDGTYYCLGRDADIQWIFLKLSTVKAPSNVFITGQNGVGKSWIIWEMALRILLQKFSPLNECRVLLMPTDTSYRLVKKIAGKLGKKAILVFDECHLIFNTPSFSFNEKNFGFGLSPFVERLKPLLENQLRVVGLTDRPGSFLEDPAVNRRFWKYTLRELDIDTCETIIRKSAIVDELSRAFNRSVSIESEAIKMAAYFSIHFFTEESLPAKIYRILDPAAVYLLERQLDGKITEEGIKEYVKETFEKSDEEVESILEEIETSMTSRIPPQEALAKCTRNLSSLARRGKLAPAWGREELLKNIATILSAKDSNCVLLMGPPGCGKTRIEEGLAYAIHNGWLPYLSGREVLVLDIGKFNTMVSDFIKSATRFSDRYILIIDEAHRLGGMGGVSIPNIDPMKILSSFTGGGMPKGLSGLTGGMASPLEELKEPLGRGKIPTLAITTEAESKVLTKDPALNRRFISLDIQPFSHEQTLEILMREAPLIAKRYRDSLKITEQALKAALYLSCVYFRSEYQPSAAIKCLHQACAYAVSNNKTIVKEHIVVAAIAALQSKSIEEIDYVLKTEYAADHPSARLFPPGDPMREFSDDWTREARLNRFAPIVGRGEEMQKMMNTLCRPTCNNVILVGNAGTGKTTLVQQLAQLIVAEKVPFFLQGKPLLSLRLSDLLSNPKAVSQFLQSVEKYAGRYILFIDEIHLLFGNNSIQQMFSSSSSLVEQFKPLLAEGKVALIGATTPEDFCFETLPSALQRRFKKIEIKPPSPEEAFEMLQQSRRHLQITLAKRLGVEVGIGDKTLEAAISRANPEGLPASAIGLLEKAAVEKSMMTIGSEGFEVTPEDLSQKSQKVKQKRDRKGKQKARDFKDLLTPQNIQQAMPLVQQALQVMNHQTDVDEEAGPSEAPLPPNTSSPSWLSKIGNFFMAPFRLIYSIWCFISIFNRSKD